MNQELPQITPLTESERARLTTFFREYFERQAWIERTAKPRLVSKG